MRCLASAYRKRGGAWCVPTHIQPKSEHKDADSIPFIENFGGACMHSHPCMCHCPLVAPGLPFACVMHQVKTVMSVAKLSQAWQPLHSNQGGEYGGTLNTMTYRLKLIESINVEIKCYMELTSSFSLIQLENNLSINQFKSNFIKGNLDCFV